MNRYVKLQEKQAEMERNSKNKRSTELENFSLFCKVELGDIKVSKWVVLN